MESSDYTYQFVAGNLALDFVNTVAFRADPARRKDHLERPQHVQQWVSQAQLTDEAAINSGRLLGTAALRRIRTVREQLFAVFSAMAADDPIPADALARVGYAFHDCCAKRRLTSEGAEIRWTWRHDARRTDYLLYPVLTAATDLLTSASRDLIRQCEDEGCGWLFLDRSNAQTRRWCSMADCGNRNKARNYHRREAGFI